MGPVLLMRRPQAGVCGVKAFGDLLGEGPGIGPAGGVVADLGGDLARHRP